MENGNSNCRYRKKIIVVDHKREKSQWGLPDEIDGN